jgi:hypothetical protein
MKPMTFYQVRLASGDLLRVQSLHIARRVFVCHIEAQAASYAARHAGATVVPVIATTTAERDALFGIRP